MNIALRVPVFCSLILLLVGFSDSTHAQIRIGPEAGVNLGMQTEQSNTTNRNSTLKIGALAGVNIDIKILRKCYVQTGVLYVYNNIKFKNESDAAFSGFGNPKEEINDDIHN